MKTQHFFQPTIKKIESFWRILFLKSICDVKRCKVPYDSLPMPTWIGNSAEINEMLFCWEQRPIQLLSIFFIYAQKFITPFCCDSPWPWNRFYVCRNNMPFIVLNLDNILLPDILLSYAYFYGVNMGIFSRFAHILFIPVKLPHHKSRQHQLTFFRPLLLSNKECTTM